MAAYLTRDDIVSITGVENLEQLPELEILFTSFDELGALDFCPNLRRLTCINNGMKRASNLAPVTHSLQSLCLCDQDITVIENLGLPNLRELFLHRNKITKMGGLDGCPRLRKLWLFQNKIKAISGLHSVPDLQECWLQANFIKSLRGIETCAQLTSLGLAGNLISDFGELKRLSTACPKLADLSLSDIHFGRCPLTDELGYKEFTTLHLKQVKVLDGVTITKESQLNAEEAYYHEVKEFNDTLRAVEDMYQANIRQIENQHQSKESYASVLEREMAAALTELQGLVGEARGVIGKQVSRNKSFIIGNFKTLSQRITELENQATSHVHSSLDMVYTELDDEAANMSLHERVNAAEAMLTDVLCGAADIRHELHAPPAAASMAPGGGGSETDDAAATAAAAAAAHSGRRNVYFQAVGSSAADYALISSSFTRSSDFILDPPAGRPSGNSLAPLDAVELARLYRVYTSVPSHPTAPTPASPGKLRMDGVSTNAPPRIDVLTSPAASRVYCALTLEKLSLVLQFGWSVLREAVCLSPDPRIASMLAITIGDCIEYDVRQEYEHLIAGALNEENTENMSTMGEAASTLAGDTVNSPMRSDSNSNNSDSNNTRSAKGRVGHARSGQPKPASVGSAHSPQRSRPATSLTRLKSALDKQLVVLLSCKFLAEAAGINTIGDSETREGGNVDTAASGAVSSAPSSKTTLPTNISNIHVPQAEDLRTEMVRELKKVRRAQVVTLEYSSSGTNTVGTGHAPSVGRTSHRGILYLVPSAAMEVCAAVDSVCLALSPPVDATDTGARNLEGRLELLCLPTTRIDDTAEVVPNFRAQVSTDVRQYLDKLLEELDGDTAEALLRADSEVSFKEGQLKHVRERIEEERRGQEGRLRQARGSAAENTGSAGAGMESGSERNLHQPTGKHSTRQGQGRR